jgi:hypothetical protein
MFPPSTGPSSWQNISLVIANKTAAQEVDSIRKLEAEAETLKQGGKAMEQVAEAQEEQAQMRMMSLVSMD